MKVSRRQAARNREAVLGAASRMFRERGVEATSVAEVFREVGLTHGGLYAQFPGGKEALAAEAIVQAFAERRQVWDDLAGSRGPAECLQAIVESYVSAEHRDDPGAGCPTPSTGAEAGRRGGPLRSAYTNGVRELAESLTRVTPGESVAERRRAALHTLSTLAGAVLIARAVDDPALADEVHDTGETMVRAKETLLELGAAAVHTACLHYKPEPNVTGTVPDFYVVATNGWVHYPWESIDPGGTLYRHALGELRS